MELPDAVQRIWEKFPRRPRSKRGPLVVATWDQAQIYFLVVTRRGDAVRALQHGSVNRTDGEEPLKQLSDYLRELNVTSQRLVLLLPRIDLEMTTIEVPAADDDELPSLVQMEVEQGVGESDRELVVDFLMPDHTVPDLSDSSEKKASDEEAPAVRVIAYWMFQENRQRLQQRAAEAGFRLEAISARQLGPLGLLRSQRVLSEPLTVVIAFYAAEIEFTFFRGAQILVLRSVRAGSHDVESLTDQIQTEVRRTASLTDFGTPGETPLAILLARGDAGPVGGELAQEQLAEALSARVIGSHGPVQSDAVDEDPVLWGAASDFLLGKLPIDLLAPKESPVPPNPVYRWAAIGTAAAAALMIVAYFLLADVNELRNEVDRQQAELEEATQVTAKIQEKADEARFVQQWLGDQVDWLDHLQRLSREFPDGQLANARRLSAVASAGGGRIDLSVQVKNPELVAALEDQLRSAGFSVSSGQVNEQTRGTEYPWQFETRVGFHEEPPEENDASELFISQSDDDQQAGDQQ